jgi:cytidylate kinase
MGSAAAVGVKVAVPASSDEDLKQVLSSLPSGDRQKLGAALASLQEAKGTSGVTAEVLAKQNSQTSQAVLEAYAENPSFQRLSEQLCKEIIQRDSEDGEKLAKGIKMAVEKGVLPSDVTVESTTQVSVSGKSADAVAAEIIAALGDAPSKGCVMTLQGLSGTGKGTTVAKLKDNLPNAQTWSNGNIFRSLTLLAVTCTEKENCSLEDALKPEKLKEFCNMLEFDKFGKDVFDVKINGLGLEYFVSDIEKTVLKETKVSTNIPTVAEVTQGEVVRFVSGALEKMAASGINVLVEGRQQTLDHIRTPHRFELVLDDSSIIGKRQAALKIGAIAWDDVKSAEAGADVVQTALEAALNTLVFAL